MKNSRPRIKYSQTPHSISRRIETITNKTASALLSLITRKTIGFGRGAIELAYAQIAEELEVTQRTISTAAKRLEECGDIVRERVRHGIYRWRVVLEKDEVLFDPEQTYATKACGELEVLNVRSGVTGKNDQDQPERSIRTQEPAVEHPEPCQNELEQAFSEQNSGSLKKVSKEKYLKKQQQAAPTQKSSSPQEPKSKTQLAPRSGDEPLYKFCLRSLKSYGVRQRVARKLVREFDHEVIESVLDTVPQLSGVDNVAGYLVAAIKDGGYGQIRFEDKKNAHQVTGGRSNYAHLTDDNVKSERHKSVKGEIDAPIVCKSVEETKAEQQRLELERLQREKSYREEGLTLGQRFQLLSEDVKAVLKRLAREQLEKMVPATGRREEMLRDKTFQRIANRTILELFFEGLDRFGSSKKALERVMVPC